MGSLVIDGDVAAYRALRQRMWDVPTPAGPKPMSSTGRRTKGIKYESLRVALLGWATRAKQAAVRSPVMVML